MSQIRKYRERAGLTQTELAKKLKVAEITVRSWELKTRSPPLKRLREIAKALKVSAGELL